MSPSRQIDALTDCLLHYSRQSKSKVGERLKRRMLRAVELQKPATDTFKEMVDSIPGNSGELRITYRKYLRLQYIVIAYWHCCFLVQS